MLITQTWAFFKDRDRKKMCVENKQYAVLLNHKKLRCKDLNQVFTKVPSTDTES